MTHWSLVWRYRWITLSHCCLLLVGSFAPIARVVSSRSTTTFSTATTPSTATRSASPSSRSSSTALMGIKGFRSWFESQFPNAILGFKQPNSNDTFDHVLVDVNQLLHVSLRKSRTDGHGLTLLMKELDAVVELATPTQSLVLAMDGPPSAAKLATQRRRRYGTLVKADWKLKQLQKLQARIKPKVYARKQRRTKAEVRTLRITPGTNFMHAAENAILYWAWQRLHNPRSALARRNVKIYLSSSLVPGEGEVKLLEWIYNRDRKGASVCILGGDSDLVLEGLVIPPASTHNVFVLLPDGSDRYLSVSLWETTRRLHQYLPHATVDNIMKVRTDLVLLLILNGNDYLPKLRGSSGFNKLFHSYLKLHREWDARGTEAYIVDPDTLEFNIPFALAFFERLAAIAPANLFCKEMMENNTEDRAVNPLQRLNSLAEGSFIPAPLKFEVVGDDGEGNDANADSNDDDDDDDDGGDNPNDAQLEGGTDDAVGGEDDGDDEDGSDSEYDEETVLVRLMIGTPGTENFLSYEVWHPKSEPMKLARQELSRMALDELFGDDMGNSDDEDGELWGINSSGYDWEISRAVDAKVDTYLYGLFWCLQTYQDGFCIDYAYNYGRRSSPTASVIVDYLKSQDSQGRAVGLHSLNYKKTSPVNAGVSCLAALPSLMKDTVPEPYGLLDDELVEGIYASCMDPEDNYFDLHLFRDRCEQELDKLRSESSKKPTKGKAKNTDDSTDMSSYDQFWTVVSRVPRALSRPCQPPPPFSDRMSKLKANNRIKISRINAAEGPRPRSVWGTAPEGAENLLEIHHSDLGPHLRDYDLTDVPFRSVYKMKPSRSTRIREKRKEQKKEKLEKKKQDPSTKAKADRKKEKVGKKAKRKGDTKGNGVNTLVDRTKVDVEARLKVFRLSEPTTELARTSDGVTAMACLKQLEDAGFVGSMEWLEEFPSQSSYASFDPKAHELTTLTVLPGSGKEALLTSAAVATQDRDVLKITKQAMRHHLAAQVLDTIFSGFGHKWTSLTFGELKAIAPAVSGARQLQMDDTEP